MSSCCVTYYLLDGISSCLSQKERRLLENRRLDLDACKTRLKKAKAAEAKAAVSPWLPSTTSPPHHSYKPSPGWGVGLGLKLTHLFALMFAV